MDYPDSIISTENKSKSYKSLNHNTATCPSKESDF